MTVFSFQRAGRLHGSLWLGACSLLLGCPSSPDAEPDDSKPEESSPEPTPSSALPSEQAPESAASQSAESAPTQKEKSVSVGPSPELFEPHRILDVSMTMAPEDWTKIRYQGRDFGVLVENCETKTPTPDIFDYVKADVTIDGTKLAEVGVRKKGFLGSLSVARPSLKIKANEYDKRQRYQGSRRLTLNNNYQDLSLLRTCLTYEVFRAAKLPSPRCNFARVSVNGEDLGVYTHVESIRKPFLRRSFDQKIGDLFESQAADFVTDLILLWEAKLGKKQPDHRPIQEIADAVDKGGETMLKTVEKWFDLDELVTFWATESLVNHWDGFAGSRNNVYLYLSPHDNKLHFIPWGADSAFSVRGSVVGSPPDDRAAVFLKARLVRRLYAEPKIKKLYQEKMQWLLREVWSAQDLVEYVDSSIQAISSAQGKVDVTAVESLKWEIRNRKGQVEMDLSATHIPKQEILDTCPEVLGEVNVSFDTVYRGGQAVGPAKHNNTATLKIKGKEVPVTRIEVSAGPSFITGRFQPGVRMKLHIAGQSPIDVQLSVEPINFKPGLRFESHGIATMGKVDQAGASGFRGVLSGAKIYLEKASDGLGSPVKGTLKAGILKAREIDEDKG